MAAGGWEAQLQALLAAAPLCSLLTHLPAPTCSPSTALPPAFPHPCALSLTPGGADRGITVSGGVRTLDTTALPHPAPASLPCPPASPFSHSPGEGAAGRERWASPLRGREECHPPPPGRGCGLMKLKTSPLSCLKSHHSSLVRVGAPLLPSHPLLKHVFSL